MTLESHTLLVQGVQGAKGDDLETTGVRQQVAVPVHEFVKAAHLVEDFLTRLQEEMVGVRKHDVAVDLLVKG